MDSVESRRPISDDVLLPATAGSDAETGADLRRLLVAYDDILRTVEQLGTVVRLRGRSDGPIGRHWRWRFRWLPFSRYLIAQHIARNLAVLMRYYYAREALSNGTGEDRERSRVEKFQNSLPIVPTRRVVVLVVTSWAAMSFLLAYALSLSAPLAGLPVPPIMERSVSAIALATRTTVSSLNLAGGLPILLEQVVTDWYTALSFATLLVASLYVLLLAPTNAYRLKRIMFNSQANGKHDLANIVALRHRSRTEGVYSLEAQLFHALGLKQPREIQWDLFVPLLPFIFAVLIVSINVPSLSSAQLGVFAYTTLAFLLVLLVARLGFLLAIGRRRERKSLTPSSTSWSCPNCGYWIPVRETVCNFCSYSFAMNRCVRANASALASLACGVGGIWLIGFPASISGIFLGLTARRQIGESRGLQQGLVLANIGVIVGLVGLVFSLVIVVLVLLNP